VKIHTCALEINDRILFSEYHCLLMTTAVTYTNIQDRNFSQYPPTNVVLTASSTKFCCICSFNFQSICHATLYSFNPFLFYARTVLTHVQSILYITPIVVIHFQCILQYIKRIVLTNYYSMLLRDLTQFQYALTGKWLALELEHKRDVNVQ